MTSSWHGVRAVVLGGSGFIGRWVTRELLHRGATVTSVSRTRSGEHPAADVIADLSRSGEARAVLGDLQPDIAFNLAGYGVERTERDPALAEALNARLVAELCEALLTPPARPWSGLRLVHAGSALEYGHRRDDLREDLPGEPTTDYGRTKFSGTLALARAHERHGLKAVTARLFTVYGPGEHEGRLLPSLLAAARSGTPVRLSPGTQQRDFTCVRDVVEGLLRLGLLGGAVPPIVNVATGRLTTVRGFAETAAEVLGIPSERLRFGELPGLPEEMSHAPVSIARLSTITGWKPALTPREGVAWSVTELARSGPRSPSA